MHKILSCLFALIILSKVTAQKIIIAKNPDVITGKLIKVTKSLRDFTAEERIIPNIIVRDENGIIRKDKGPKERVEPPGYPSSQIFNVDPALQNVYPNNSHLQNAAYRAIVANFNGIGYQPLNPPDPTLCVGPNHVIQMVNGSSGALLKVFNKSGGEVVAQKYLDQITGKGGLGDPIALYDHLADRFILTEFANSDETITEGLIIAVSQTSDPAGAWYVYYFSTGTSFPDYPKFSIWSDAYYATTNDFAGAISYSGSSVYAFDKAKMLAGNATATMQRFTLGTASKHFSMSPVGLEGSTLPPTGSGGLIAYMQDDTWTASSTDVDSIGMFEFKVDFINPSNTQVIANSSFATTAFKSGICTATRGRCISQPGTATNLEALHQKIMNQPIYRNFNGYEGIVLSHVVDKGSSISGIRWYELRKTTGNWNIHQQSTYAPDNTHRFLPAVCYDKYGNIGLAYNVASSTTGVYPGARYTGRKECDVLNTMTYSEDVLIAGTNYNGSSRYGDYNQLVCDPDGVTFWFTCEYNVANTWSTRISSFTLDQCNVQACANPTGLSSNVTATTASLNWTAVANAISYDVDYKLNSATLWTNLATATTSTSVNINDLSQGTTYDWRVRANCSSESSGYSPGQFTTTPIVTGCPDQYEPNNTLATAVSIPAGININAIIASATDKDYYGFSTNGSQKNLKITLTNLPANYNLTLYNSKGAVLGNSGQSGTANETIAYNAKKPDAYRVYVYGATSSDFNSSQCYTLNVITGSSTFSANGVDESNESGEANMINLVKGGLKLYPVPASTAVTISFDAYAKGTADIVITNQLGQGVFYKKLFVNIGTNFNVINVSSLKAGVYSLKVNNGKDIQTRKMIIAK